MILLGKKMRIFYVQNRLVRYIDDLASAGKTELTKFCFRILKEFSWESGIDESIDKAFAPLYKYHFICSLFNAVENRTVEVIPER